jgi:hypothetical protein
MTLVERAQQAWAAFLAKSEPEKPEPIGTPNPSTLGSVLRDWEEVFYVSPDRQAAYADYRRMDQGIIETMLDTVTRAVLRFDGNEVGETVLSENDCFKVEFIGTGYATSGPKQIIEQILLDTDLRGKLRAITRDVIRNGDEFVEVQADDNGNIVGIRSYPCEQIVVKRDEKGRLARGADENGNPLAYRQLSPTGQILGAWYPHEFLHLRYAPSDKSTYSTRSLISGYRALWRKITWVEESLVVARCTRSFPRLLHIIDVTNKSIQDAKKALMDYVRAFTRKILPSGVSDRAPMTPDEDVFVTTGYHSTGDPNKPPVPRLNKVELLDPHAQGLAEIADVKMLRQQLFDRVPAEMFGAQDQTPTELTSQQLAFGDLLGDIQRQILERQLIRPLFNMGLRLKGYDPRKVRYQVVWPSPIGTPSWMLSDAQYRSALRMVAELEHGATSRLHYRMRQYGETQEQAEEVLKRWEEENKRFGPMDKGSDSSLTVAGGQAT